PSRAVPRPTRFPYTTLFRSKLGLCREQRISIGERSVNFLNIEVRRIEEHLGELFCCSQAATILGRRCPLAAGAHRFTGFWACWSNLLEFYRVPPVVSVVVQVKEFIPHLLESLVKAYLRCRYATLLLDVERAQKSLN